MHDNLEGECYNVSNNPTLLFYEMNVDAADKIPYNLFTEYWETDVEHLQSHFP